MPLIPEIEPDAIGKPELELKAFTMQQSLTMSNAFAELNQDLAQWYANWKDIYGEVEASQMCMSVVGKFISEIAARSTEPENVFRSIIARGWEDYRMWELRVKSARPTEIR